MKDIKFFIGPMSKNIVDSLIDFSEKENKRIGIVASRRQIEYDGGYVNNWNTKQFSNYIKNKTDKIILERDHGGIGQGKQYDNGVMSFYEDTKYFDIIHIDPWKNYQDFNKGLIETIDMLKFLNKINKKCLFEIGTEEAIRSFTNNELEEMISTIYKNVNKQLFDNIIYVVIQSGTKILGTENIGKFNLNRLIEQCEICKKYDKLSKEHNGDYLNDNDIKIRFQNGLDTLNIAPEFGFIESSIIYENVDEEIKEQLFNICLKSNKWVKWVDKDFNPYENKEKIIKLTGHYIFSDLEFKKLEIDLDELIKTNIYNKIKNNIKI